MSPGYLVAALALLVTAGTTFPAAPPLPGGNLPRYCAVHYLGSDHIAISLYGADEPYCCIYNLPRNEVVCCVDACWLDLRFSAARRAIVGRNTRKVLCCWNVQGKLEWSNDKIKDPRSWFLGEKEIIVVTQDSSILRLDWKKGTVKSRFALNLRSDPCGCPEVLRSVALSPLGRIAVGSHKIGGLSSAPYGRILSDRPGGDHRFFGWKEGSIARMAFAMNGRYLITVNDGEVLSIWDGETGKPIKLPSLRLPISSTAFCLLDKGTALLNGNEAGALAVYSLATGKQEARKQIVDAPITAVAASPDGKQFLVVTHKYTITVLSRKGLRVERTISAEHLHRQLARLREKR
jgi:WD40 repeat protein